jgi:lipid-binding SYLF domain-containing protein
MLRHFRIHIVGLAALVGVAWPGYMLAQDASDEVERIQKSIAVLRDLTTAPEEGIPQYLLERAEAIVVIPSLVRGGFIVGAKHGKGVVSVRDRANNTWSPPAFMNMTGGSIGWQIGAEAVDLVLLVMNKNGVDELLEDRFTLGGNLSVAAGPVGRSASAATNAQVSSQIVAYSKAKGLFAGATLEGAALHEDDDSNEAFYGSELPARTILAGRPAGAATPPAVSMWRDTLQRLTMPKGSIKDRARGAR